MSRQCGLFLLLAFALFASVACNRTPIAPASVPVSQVEPAAPKEDPETAETLALKESVRSFHETLASGDLTKQKKALAAIVFAEKDVEKLFPNHEQYWGVLQFARFGLEEDLPKIGPNAASRGAIKSIKIVDLRKQGHQWTSKVAKDVPAYSAIVEYESSKFEFGPLFHVSGRWVWFPNLEKLAVALPAKGTSS